MGGTIKEGSFFEVVWSVDDRVTRSSISSQGEDKRKKENRLLEIQNFGISRRQATSRPLPQTLVQRGERLFRRGEGGLGGGGINRGHIFIPKRVKKFHGKRSSRAQRFGGR